VDWKFNRRREFVLGVELDFGVDGRYTVQLDLAFVLHCGAECHRSILERGTTSASERRRMVNFISMKECAFKNGRKGERWKNRRSGEESLEMFGDINLDSR
jgi:hypothetical protein